MPIAVSHHPGRLSKQSRREKLRRRAKKILKAQNLTGSDLSIVLCDDPFIRDLNREWRNKDKATDVLSFPLASPKEIENFQKGDRSKTPVLGDIVISLETVERQKKSDEDTEILRLMIHGFVHLLGYDHGTDVEFNDMYAVEKDLAALFKLNLS